MNLLERHLACAYRADSPAWDDCPRLAREDAWTLALADQLAPEDADFDFYWTPEVPEAPLVVLHMARLRGQLRARLLGALHRRRWVVLMPSAWELAPALPVSCHAGLRAAIAAWPHTGRPPSRLHLIPASPEALVIRS